MRGGLEPDFVIGGGHALMRIGLWAAFFLVCNVLGVEVFRAAMTLPFEDAVLPAVLSIPLIGLTAFGARGLVAAWQRRDE
jgi:hypothetical protein